MAEYWKSAPRHWCKQCKIFIRDTPFEKTQHEASPKHQGSLKRFLREIHKDNDRQQRDSQRAKSEVERLRQAVGGGSSAAKDDGAPAPPKRSAAPAPKQEQRVSMEERKKQMAQLAEMGIAIPDEYRGDMALAGEWQTLSETKLEPQAAEGAAKALGVRKRKHEGDEEEEEAHAAGQAVSKGWGSRMRTYPGAQDDDEDLDALLASTKDLKKTKTSTPAEEPEEQKPEPTSSNVKEEAPDSKEPETAEPTQVKVEETGGIPAPPTEEKPQSEEAPGFVFKKRKPKVMKK